MILINADHAIIDSSKLIGYVLNREHPEGKHKAYLFEKVLGITAMDEAEVKKVILTEIKANPATLGKVDQYGVRYSVKFEWTRNGNTATVLTSWIVKTDELMPRLTSCYIVDR